MVEKKKSLAVNAVLNTVKTVASMVLSVLTFPYAARALGAEALGTYNFSYSIVSYAILIAGLGTMSYAIREGTRYIEDTIKMRQFVSEIFSISVISTAISYVCLYGVLFFSPNLESYREIVLIISAEIVCSTIGVSWLSNIYEDFFYITVRTLAFQVLYVVLLVVFVHQPTDILKFVIIWNSKCCSRNKIYLNVVLLEKSIGPEQKDSKSIRVELNIPGNTLENRTEED